MKTLKFGSILTALIIAVSPLTQVPAYATVAESYDFNTAGDLANNFVATLGSGFNSSYYNQANTGGIGGTNSINAPSSLNAVFGSKTSYTLGSVGSKYTFSSFMKSVGNSGYSGMGFSAAPATTNGGTPFRPSDALGISVHGGGFVFHNGATNYSANWQDASTGSITAVTSASVNDLLNTASADKWFKIIFSIEVRTGDKFTIRVEVWPADGTTGNLRNGSASAIFEVRDISNPSINRTTPITSYINFSGYRVTNFDNFSVDLVGNASVVSAGAPVVLTTSSSVASSQLTVGGDVSSENGSAVTERGVVYGTSPNPTLANSKIAAGTGGTGTFSITTPNLSAGTYYARAYAINSTGTTYGSQETQTITAAPTVTWAPTNLSSYVAAGSLTPSALAISNSSGAITYSVQNAGTTGCAVNSSTAVITYAAAGDCVVRASVASASPYTAATLDKTFTILSNLTPTLTWAPSNTSAYATTASITPTTGATSNSSGAITYSVQSVGTTGCIVDATTGVITFSSAGLCVIRASLASSSPYNSAVVDKTFTVLANTVSTAPTSVTATAESNRATVSWIAPNSNGGSSVTSYTVTASPDGATCVATAPATSCEITGLANGTAYTFSVTATNATGSSLSSVSSSQVTPMAPSVPSSPSSGGSGSVAPIPQVTEKPVTKVSAIDVSPGKKPGTSLIKLKVIGNQAANLESGIQIKLMDLTGKVIKVLSVPITTSTDKVEVSLPLPVGDYTVEASTTNAAGVASDAVVPGAILVSKPTFTRVSLTEIPILAGIRPSTPITFAPNSATLSADAKAKLVALAIQLKASNQRLSITGFSASGVSSKSIAVKLATQRALNVAKFLQAKGLGGLVYYSGYGPITLKQGQGIQRKVELRLIG